MTTEFARGNNSLQDALYALSLVKPLPDADVLEDMVRRYPEFASELTDLAIELALDALRFDEQEDVPSKSSVEEETMVLKAMSRFHNRLHAVKTEASQAAAKAEAANPFASLGTPEIRALGQRLNANTVFVLKLRDRVIDINTMPKSFIGRTAEAMRVPTELIAEYLAAEPIIGTQAHFKSDRKPEVAKKQTFADAVQNSGLTDVQKRDLLSH